MKRCILMALIIGLGRGNAAALPRSPTKCFDCGGGETAGSVTRFFMTLDVPANLRFVGTVMPWFILRRDTSVNGYALEVGLPNQTPIAGLQRMSAGDWLISLKHPTNLGGTIWLPQDVIRRNPATGTFSCFLSGAALSIPVASRIDALFLAGGDGGSLVLSFNVPTMIGGVIYQGSDLVKFNPTGPACTGWAHAGAYFTASTSTPPIPAGTNVVGADAVGGRTILGFDVPTLLGTVIVFPGDLVSWNGTRFEILYHDSAWPAQARMNDFAFVFSP